MAAFLAGQKLTAQHLNDLLGTETSNTQSTSGTTTSTSYTATLTGGTACSFTFTAPSSGKIWIANAMELQNSTTSATVADFAIREGSVVGSGTVFRAATDDTALYINNVTASTRGRFSMVVPITGLTPGLTYNIQGQYRVTGGTGTFNRKNLALLNILN